MMLMVLLLLAQTPDAARGKALFAQRCSMCHGEGGKGDGVVASSLKPGPADFTAARWSDERLERVFREGVPGTAMPAQADLSSFDRQALRVFIQSLSPPKPEGASAALVENGRQLFAIRCAACHGPNADGRGPSRTQMARQPADFTQKQPTRARIEAVLEHGVPGTAMTPMRRLLSAREIDALVAFVQHIYGRQIDIGVPAEADR